MPQSTMTQNIDNSGIVAQQVSLSGEYVAGRDIHIENKSFISDHVKFSEINLDPYKKGEYISPLFTDLLFKHIKEKRLLVVGGGVEFYKDDFIRHLAALIAEETGLRAKEWLERGGSFNLFSSISEEKAPCVFIFPSTSPIEVNYDLRRLANLADKYNHYILISTRQPAQSWKLPTDIRQDYWFEVPQSHLYHPGDLTRCLIQELERTGSHKRFENKVEHLQPETELIKGISLEEIAAQLETIDKIQIFTRLVNNEERTISRASLKKLLDNVVDSKNELISNWFLSLAEKEKETAIVLSLFEGLYDDQFFEATERIVDEAWQNRETKLKSLDYCDLDSLFNFFNVHQIDFNQRLIYSKFSNQRMEFFKAIWFSHRRKVLSALPVLEELIHDSGKIEKYNWELYGTTERKERLLKVVSEVLSDIGMLNSHIVEPYLLRLATDPVIEIQEITAKALARWREYEREEQLFEILERWRNEIQIQEMIRSLFAFHTEDRENEDENHRQPTPNTIVLATIALTIGYASSYDEPNKLSDKLIRNFIALKDERNEYVRERFRKVTIPQVVGNHLWQLRLDLFELMKYLDLLHNVAMGIALAYEKFPKRVKDTIDEWLDYVNEHYRYRSANDRITHRDAVLITVILALSEIRYSDENEFNSKVAYALISKLQDEEFHEAVEKFYLHFVLRQINLHDSKIDPAILGIIEKISKQRHPELIESFTKIYLNQRRNLKNGEETISVDGVEYQVWLKEERPLTKIEKTMMDWLLEDSLVGQQIAVEALYQFNEVFDFEEKIIIRNYLSWKDRQKQEEAPEQTAEAPKPIIPLLAHNWTSRLIGWAILGRYSGRIRKVLENLLPVLVRKKYTSQEHLDIIADKLNRHGEEENRKISEFIARFPGYFNNFSLILAFGVIIIIILAIIIIALFDR